MKEVNISIDVHCTHSDWVQQWRNKRYRDTPFRIYVDGDLLTERNWIWGNNHYIKEDIWVKIDQFAEHILTLEPVRLNPAQASFNINNFVISNIGYNHTQIDECTVSFKIQ